MVSMVKRGDADPVNCGTRSVDQDKFPLPPYPLLVTTATSPTGLPHKGPGTAHGSGCTLLSGEDRTAGPLQDCDPPGPRESTLSSGEPLQWELRYLRAVSSVGLGSLPQATLCTCDRQATTSLSAVPPLQLS